MNPWFHTYTEHGNEAANRECMPTTVDTLGEIERDQIEYFCLLFLNDVLSPSLYMLIQLFSLISVNSGFKNIHRHTSHVGEYSAIIHLHFRE